MPTAKTNDQKKSSQGTKTTTGSKAGAATKGNMPAVPTARERAKDMDTKRRSDAESNEL